MTKVLKVLLVIGLALVALSPVQAQVQSDIATERAQLQSDRQAIVAANLPLTEEQATAFWPMYRDYRAEMQKLGDRLVDVIVGYAHNAEALTDDQAAVILDDLLAIQKDELKIKTDWVPKFRKILPPKAVTRFYQIENKLDAILLFEAANQVPLIEHEAE